MNSGRINVDVFDIMREKSKNASLDQIIKFGPDFMEYRPKLYKSLYLPSYVHGYSLAIEYMRDWFVNNFPENYFKTIFINGKHVLDDWKHWNNYNIKKEKPMLAIIPTVNVDWDRENVDLYLGSKDIMLRRSNFQDSFIKDYKNMIFLYMQMRQMEMTFSFRVRVESRAQQLDLMNKMELWFRCGSTQQDHLSADIHIPYEIMLNIAKDTHFEIEDVPVGATGKLSMKMIKDIPAFVNYLNSHSSAPITFKIRGVNQKPEFFVRARDLYTHIAVRDKIRIDDGERDGKLDTNFHLEMEAILRMPIPHFYAYMNQKPLDEIITISEKKPVEALYSIEPNRFPPENQMGWKCIAVTTYCCDKGDTYIDLREIFDNAAMQYATTAAGAEYPVTKVMKRNMKLGLSPEAFIDVVALNEEERGHQLMYHLDYHHLNIIIDEEITYQRQIDIGIYADMAYINSELITMNNYDNTRINKTQ